MGSFFHKTKGAISVFLVLVLLPTLLFGGLVTDAARIYFSKVVISDAGEMAMNAALAQYNEDLLDEYGLLVMNNDPSSYSTEIQSFFARSLNAGGLPDEGDYSRLLDLAAEKVSAVAVAGSEIYQTEVERQQIIEYMKYRAPLCLVDLVLEKLDAMKDTKKKAEAVEAQMEFVESMEECQDAIDEAYKALKELWQDNNDFKNNYSAPNIVPVIFIQNLLGEAEIMYQTELVKTHLKIVAISKYTEAPDNNMSIDDMAISFTNRAQGVDMDKASESFEQYIGSLFYKNGVENAGGVDKIIDDWKADNPEPIEEEEIPEAERDSDATTRETEEHVKWRTDLEKLQEIVINYKNEETRISGYSNQLRRHALDIIKEYSGSVSACSNQAESVKYSAVTALEKLKALKKLIDEAREKWQTWSDKENAAYSDEEQKSAGEYKDFFTEEDGEKYDILVQKVQKVHDFYDKLVPKLAEETFCEKALSTESYEDQYGAQHSRAEEILSDVTITGNAFFYDMGTYTSQFNEAYHKADWSSVFPSWSEYTDDDFYKKLEEYRADESKVNQGDKNKANGTLSEGGNAGKEADSEEGYPDFNWDSINNANNVLPSRVLNAVSQKGDPNMTGVGGDVDDRKGALKKFKDSISAATTFLDGLDRILADTLEDLYVAEYAMQMFSYYTVDKNLDGSVKGADDIITLSGCKMGTDSRQAYKAEAEYILWGNAQSKENVKAVVMTLFGIRLLFNSLYVFTDTGLRGSARLTAHGVCGPAQFLVPVVQVLVQLGYAAVETANDIKWLKQGYGVTIFKDKNTWSTVLSTNGNKANTGGVTLSYAEYMRIFLILRMMTAGDKDILARIADCIQINNDYDLLKGYTMVAIETTVKSRTSFMRRISDMEGGPGLWSYADDYYTIHYQSILGY